MEFNPFTQEFRDNPYPAYAEMRREGPVFHVAQLGMYMVTHYDEVVELMKQPALFSSVGGVGIQVRGEVHTTVINADPPVHTRLRALVSTAFTPRVVAELEPRVREITSQLLDAVGEKFDLVRDLAVPLPVTVIAELLGIEPERRDDFKRWSTTAVSSTDEAGGERRADGERRAGILRDNEEMALYFEQVIAERRQQPRDDLVSALVRAETGEHPLTSDEVVAFCVLLLIAGNETTTNLIGNAMLALLAHPDEMARVRADRALIPGMVEEALRYDAPVQFLPRTTTQDVQLGGVSLPAGATVLPVFGSANRDERRFAEPDRFDVTRATQGQVAFGHGIHFCLGAPLARLEARVAFEELFARFSSIERADDAPLQRWPSPILRGVASLAVAVRE